MSHRSLGADRNEVHFASPVSLESTPIDVRFGDHRVWSTEISSVRHDPIRLPWPDVLKPYLTGAGIITVTRSSDGLQIACGDVTIGDSDTPREVRDSRGRWLAVNKWEALGLPLDGQEAGTKSRLLARAHALMDELAALGHRSFLSSGSLLGAIRTGEFLPHDDDIDLGRVSDKTHPADLVRESLELERALRDNGHIVVRHSHAHLQLLWLHETGELDHYVDIFTAYYDRYGLFNQPFSIRGTLDRAVLEPFEPVRLEGEEFPAPRQPQAWLALNYGESWQTPDPGFRFTVPEATRRRFDGWFGSFNLHRIYWEPLHDAGSIHPTADSDRIRAVMDLDSVQTVVDLGCGLSDFAARIQSDEKSVSAADFSIPALQKQKSKVPVRYLNLNDRHCVLEFAWDLIESGTTLAIVGNHVLEGLGGDGAANVDLFLGLVVRGASVAYLTVDTDLPDEHRFENPETWHLPLDALFSRMKRIGLSVDLLENYSRPTEFGPRQSVLVRVHRSRERRGM